MVELFIFDLDGVLLNTEPLHEAAKQSIFVAHGIKKVIDFSPYVGHPNKVFWDWARAQFQFPESSAVLERRQYEYILKEVRARQVPANRGLAELLAFLQAKGVMIGLVSSSDRYYVDQILQYLNLTEVIPIVVGGNEVAKKKPAPDGYLRALELAGVTEDMAMAVEDSEAGLAAATGAGIRSIGYRNPTSGKQDLSAAFAQVDNLTLIKQYI